jgi:hypothetical protein
MMMNARQVAMVSLSLVVVLGCNSESIPLSEFDSQGTKTICDREVRCGNYPDEATCESATFTELQVQAEAAAGKVKYDGEAAASCLAAYGALGCSASEVGAASSSVVETCSHVFTGTIVNGGACLIDQECASQSCNLSACDGASCCLGSCQAQIALGGDCSSAGAVCAGGTFCKPGISGGALCAAPIAPGQACDDASDLCAPGTFCLATSLGGPTTCAKLPAEGASCSSAGACDSPADYCDPGSMTCLPRIAVGGACPSMAGCPTYATCDANTSTCVSKGTAGAACTQSSDCISVYCPNGTCAAPSDVPACQ